VWRATALMTVRRLTLSAASTSQAPASAASPHQYLHISINAPGLSRSSAPFST